MSMLMFNAYPSAATHRIGKRVYRLPAFVLRYAMTLMAEAEAQYAEYVRDCEADAERGHRTHYCEHGTNMWTDYDNICGGCEDGWSNGDPGQRRERALNEAKRVYAQAETLIHAAEIMRANGIAYDFDALHTAAAKFLGIEFDPMPI